MTFHPPGLTEFVERRTITAVDRPHLLAYDVDVGATAAFHTSVRFEFVPDGGGTRLEFRQAGFPEETTRDEFAQVWPDVFAQLATRL